MFEKRLLSSTSLMIKKKSSNSLLTLFVYTRLLRVKNCYANIICQAKRHTMRHILLYLRIKSLCARLKFSITMRYPLKINDVKIIRILLTELRILILIDVTTDSLYE